MLGVYYFVHRPPGTWHLAAWHLAAWHLAAWHLAVWCVSGVVLLLAGEFAVQEGGEGFGDGAEDLGGVAP